MHKKLTAMVLITVLCGLVVFPDVQATQNIPAEKNVSAYKEISGLIADTWEEDYFGKMVVDPDSNTVEKDGITKEISEEFGISEKKTEKITQSLSAMEQYLNSESKEDEVFEVENNEDGNMEITAPFQTKRLIVEREDVPETYGAEMVYRNDMDHETILQFKTQEETEAACRKLQIKYGKTSCYPDRIVSVNEMTQGVPVTETQSLSQNYSWGVPYMGFDALKVQAGEKGYQNPVTVAVIDTGINKSNFMFRGRTISPNSYNFVSGNKKTEDLIGHGTHVSGIIADSTPANVQILMLKVANEKGLSSLLTIKTAMQYAVKLHVAVINLSLGFIDAEASKYNYLNGIIDKAYEHGIPVCAAAGNVESGGVNVKYCYPACYDKTITVAAFNQDGTVANYSNWGNAIDFAAPGTEIYSADYKGTLRGMSGTSMAAPHITAAIAYIKMMQSNLSVSGVYKELKTYCKDMGVRGKDTDFGWGCPILSNLMSRQIVYRNEIVILRPSLIKASNVTGGIRLTWKRAAGAAKYCIYRKESGKVWKKIATVSRQMTSYVDKKGKNGKKYTYRIRAYNMGRYGNPGNEKTLYCLIKPGKGKLKKKSGRKVMMTWKKKRYVSKYQIQYARNAAFKKAKSVSVDRKQSSLLTKKLKKGHYYFRIRYYYKKGSIKSWSAWSKTEKIRIP